MHDFLTVLWLLRWHLLVVAGFVTIAIVAELYLTRGSDYYHPDVFDDPSDRY